METAGVTEGPNDFLFRANAKVATGVDSEKFFELLISRLTTDGI
jgi:hypothetical protein